MKRPRLLVSAFLAFTLAACSMQPVRTATLRIQPTVPMIAKKVARPLYVVLDPAQVPDRYTIPEGTVKELEILEIRYFVRRDLRAGLAALFEYVEVVPPTAQIPAGALVGQVQIQRFSTELVMASSGSKTVGAAYGQMGWGFAIREPGQSEFAFSHTESVTGTFPLVQIDQTAEMMESTYRLAIEHLLAKIAEPEVLARLNGAPAAAPASGASAPPAPPAPAAP